MVALQGQRFGHDDGKAIPRWHDVSARWRTPYLRRDLVIPSQ